MTKNSQGSQRGNDSKLQRKPHQINNRFFSRSQTLQARRERNDVFKILKKGNHQPRIIFPAELSFRYGETKAFTKQKLREFITKPALQMLKCALPPETKRQNYTKHSRGQAKAGNWNFISEMDIKHSQNTKDKIGVVSTHVSTITLKVYVLNSSIFFTLFF